ncbi:nuclear transport factor 2 family protein [Streptomyces sp. NBC_00094]|uniref:nuclear transport factor 2 family protein n=1 Tax=Streptomyces sp. NBC_00094 TaxID=2903620 RepID=UPI00224CCBF2|nr:nuclear transport factor 2 family protein [Streptomyces sp. NBC_00094]MCX5390847.1 nuclear transport factor 2 family protein [Streptomyces sp. NBC_00094]
MPPRTTAAVIDRFNHAFAHHEPDALDDLVGEGCVMEAIQPAPDGERYEGRDACLAFWRALAADRTTQFTTEDVAVAGDRATIRWRYRFGDDPSASVRGVNLMRVEGGRIVEALGYSKTAGEVPLAAEAGGGE